MSVVDDDHATQSGHDMAIYGHREFHGTMTGRLEQKIMQSIFSLMQTEAQAGVRLTLAPLGNDALIYLARYREQAVPYRPPSLRRQYDTTLLRRGKSAR
ncbi:MULTISPECIES: hypothetical protein [unclassified Rhizobium]|uniref:hypothetical protein n=1 Tax=Rhizobium TaxID=379 RepID=UPI00084CD058|nr:MULTISPECIES: hypothetical protein [unclassified Rhizobium]OEC95491.1 hypothetical protein A9Z06_30435 [Rhizobium sp. YK2]QYA15103.1 hypothetical protein J5284_25050 [Rhizobium sp. AB2/73]UEQ84030.1 hypothetical protein I8E17_22100 [Rhizobium sp. AB2/73]